MAPKSGARPAARRCTRGLALMLLLPGCNLLLPLDKRSSRDVRPDTTADSRLDSTATPDLGDDTIACIQDQEIQTITPTTPYQNPACAGTLAPADDLDCDGLPYDSDYHRNQDFWPNQLNPLVFLDGFTQPGLPGWTVQGNPSWTCPAVTIHSGEAISVDLPSTAGTQYLVQIRFSYGTDTNNSWAVGISAPSTRTCTLEKTSAGMRYCLNGLSGCDSSLSWLTLAPGRPLVMQLWSLDAGHPQAGSWCRIFDEDKSPSVYNLKAPVTSVAVKSSLKLFATNQTLVVDQVRVFAAPF